MIYSVAVDFTITKRFEVEATSQEDAEEQIDELARKVVINWWDDRELDALDIDWQIVDYSWEFEEEEEDD